MLRAVCRRFSVFCVRQKGVIGQDLTSPDALLNFLRTPTGSVHDVIPKPNSTAIVDESVVRKMLKLSGLEDDAAPEAIQKWTDALNTQIGFINHLRENDMAERSPQEKASEVFRFLESDHIPQKQLSLSDLEQQILEYNLLAADERDQFDANEYIRTRIENVSQAVAKE